MSVIDKLTQKNPQKSDGSEKGVEENKFEIPKWSKASSDGDGLWMMSFSDMTLVLLCFFALIISVSSMDEAKYDTLTEGFKSKDIRAEKHNLSKLKQEIDAAVARNNLSQDVATALSTEGLKIEFQSSRLFKVGSDTPMADFIPSMKKVLAIISRAHEKYKISVEGHTDDLPLGKNSRFADNWELSSARAFRVRESLEAMNVRENRLAVIAYAHTRPKIAIAGKSGQALMAARDANRRVVIHLR